MLAEIPEEEFAAALEACAAEVLWEADIREAPVDSLEVAERVGLVVVRDYSIAQRGRLVHLANAGREGQAAIVVGQLERPEREQWAIAHEIGEGVAYRVYERLGVAPRDASPSARELVANRFASCLLLPRRWFAADGVDRDWDLIALKDRYVTASHELIARRMLDMRPGVVITVFDHGRVRWRRSNAVARAPALLPEEAAAWEECHETGLSIDDAADAETGVENIRCWAIHEPGWKREIMRTEIVDY